jgi:hypothetical protein
MLLLFALQIFKPFVRLTGGEAVVRKKSVNMRKQSQPDALLCEGMSTGHS